MWGWVQAFYGLRMGNACWLLLVSLEKTLFDWLKGIIQKESIERVVKLGMGVLPVSRVYLELVAWFLGFRLSWAWRWRFTWTQPCQPRNLSVSCCYQFYQKDTCICKLNTEQLTIAKTWNQTRCPSTVDWMWQIYTMYHQENVAYILHGILHSLKKEWNHILCSNMNAAEGYNPR